MTFFDIIFYTLAVIIVCSAGTAVFSNKKSNIIISLFCTFMGIAGLFTILSSAPIAFIYLILFGFGITALFFFVFTHEENVKTDKEIVKKDNSILPVLITGVSSALLTGIIITTRWKEIPSSENNFSFSDVSALLISKYSLPLLITSIVIFIVIIGAFYLIGQERDSA